MHHARFVAAVLVPLLALAATSPAAELETRQLSLQDCFQLALEHNLDVQIERFGPEIADFNYEATRGAYDPTFTSRFRRSYERTAGSIDARGIFATPDRDTDFFSFAGLTGMLPSGLNYTLGPLNTIRNNQPGFFGANYTSSIGVTVSQPLLRNLWIDDARRQILVARKNKEISAYTLENQVINVLTRVEQVYYELIFAHENVKVQAKALELAEKLLEENRKRVEVGAMAPLDEKQAESQVAARRADLLDARRALGTQQNNLRNLLTDEYGDWHRIRIEPADPLVAVPEELNLQESWQQGLAQRPDLLQARAEMERRDIDLRYRKNQIYPSLNLEGGYGQTGRNTDMGEVVTDLLERNANNHYIGLVFSVPLYNRGAKNSYQATRAEKQQALLRLKKLEQDVVVSIDEAVNLSRSYFERIEATRQARLYAEAALDAEEKKLASGKSTSFVVLQLQRDLTNARSSEIRAMADYHKALSTLSQARGSTLQRNKLTLQVK